MTAAEDLLLRILGDPDEDLSLEYRLILDFPGYRVGNDGSVWTCLAQVHNGGFGTGFSTEITPIWTRMKATKTGGGYLDVQLRKSGGPVHRLVHRLVLESFVGPCPEGMECAHDNGKPDDNRVGNLSWKTKNDNQGDRVRHGTHCRGERQKIASLTDEIASKLIVRLDAGESRVAIARECGVSRTVISRLANGKTYRHLRGANYVR